MSYQGKVDYNSSYPHNTFSHLSDGKEILFSIIDWDTSRFVPRPSAIQHPLFLADIPGWQSDDVSQDMTFEEDRRYLE